MLPAVLLGKELELTLLGNVASGSQPLDGLETRPVRLSGHNATLVLHQITLLKAASRVGCTAVEHLLLGTDRGNATATLLAIVATSHSVVALAHILAAVLAHHAVIPVHHFFAIVFGIFHLVLPKQHIFFKEGRVSPHRKRTVLNGPTDPFLQPFYIRNWI